MLQKARVVAFAGFELLKENQHTQTPRLKAKLDDNLLAFSESIYSSL